MKNRLMHPLKIKPNYHDSTITLLGREPKELNIGTQTITCMHMLQQHYSQQRKGGNKLNANNRWINKMWYMHIMDYYLATKGIKC
jgi:hypothetical protein